MFSFFSRRARYTRSRKHHTDSSLTSVIKITLSTLLTIGITSGIIYAASINSVTTQTIASGDTIGAGWYQSVNDRLANIFVNGTNIGIGTGATSAATLTVSGTIIASTPTATGQLATKGYVDAAVSGAGGGYVVGGTYGSVCNVVVNDYIPYIMVSVRGIPTGAVYQNPLPATSYVYPLTGCSNPTGTMPVITCATGFTPQTITAGQDNYSMPVWVYQVQCMKQ